MRVLLLILLATCIGLGGIVSEQAQALKAERAKPLPVSLSDREAAFWHGKAVEFHGKLQMCHRQLLRRA